MRSPREALDESALMDERPEMRGDQRPSDSRARAAARAAELLEHGVMEADSVDKFHIDPTQVPDGWSYEWKRRTVYNAEDPAYQVGLAQTGWEPVPADRHPQFMPEGWKGSTIEREGMVLMERPKQITDMIRKRDERKARAPVEAMEDKLAGAAPGQFERKKSSGESLVNVKKTVEPMPIPD